MPSSSTVSVEPRAEPAQAPQASDSGGQAPFDYIAAEHARARHRRTCMDVERPPGHADATWGLALSGGGIRSATFCLGVLQGLTQCEAPAQSGNAPGEQGAVRRSLLPQFDYVSTVSGGGFVGSFFASLFVRRRLDPQADLDDKATAEQAYRVLTEDPPGRLKATVRFDPARPGRAPLAWLRENGRYMAPTGGASVYAAAIVIRNWCAMHYVLGTILLCAYLFLAFAHVSLIHWLDLAPWRNYVRDYELLLLGSVEDRITTIWWSPAWWLILPLAAFWLLPAGVAYWMTHPPPGRDLTSRPQRFSAASAHALFAGAVMMAFAWFGQRMLGREWDWLANALSAVGFVACMGVVWHMLTYVYQTIDAQRAGLTRAIVNGLLCLLVIAGFALIHTVAQTLYVTHGSIFSWIGSTARELIHDDHSRAQDDSALGVVGGGAVAFMVWLVRWLTSTFAEREREGWAARIPVNALIAAGAVVLLILVALFWAQLVLWIQWHGDAPNHLLLLDTEAYLEVLQVLGTVLLLALALAVIVGRYPGFLNMSTFQAYYSTRITRAYMGASNGVRYGAGGGTQRLLSVSESAPGDLMTLEQYYANPLTPMHLINICLNQNIDPAEQLVQRDRKGKPLVILPTGFALDGVHYRMPESRDARGLAARLTVGEWIGVSAAAIATGMGRAGGRGRAMLYGLANLRLGRWWESGAFAGSQSNASRVARQTFKTQTYLLDELLARFFGTQRPLQYLSDGGHYENMGLYELLRPARGVRLIVACDCGCDPHYQFEDLANLMRMVRIDFAAEIEVDTRITHNHMLGAVFGVPEDFRSTDGLAAQKCALLLNVYHSKMSYRAHRPDARVVVLKPRMIPAAAADLGQYHATHPAFPQEPTADQFYDEAQWESYRKLGLETARTVFGTGVGGDQDTYREALWRLLLQ